MSAPLARAEDIILPAPGAMVRLSPAQNPPILKGIKVNPNDPFKLDFILDQGNTRNDDQELRGESTKLIKYFLSSLTIPQKDLWVNLSPYEKDRIVPEFFGRTQMGRDLLAEDYILKQITASLIYPEEAIGRKFWQRIYEQATRKFGTTNIPVNTFNKVWIVPEKAVVYENAKAGTAYVLEAKLKVMLEQDYLALSKALQGNNPTTSENTSALGSQIVREIVIPELTREVNEGQNFAQLRQVYNSLILATWYKKKIKDSLLAQIYADRNKVAGVGYNQSIIPKPPTRGHVPEGAVSPSRNPANDVEAIYQRYLQAFKKGVYNYIKEEQDPLTQARLPRKYFSGGATFLGLDQAMAVTSRMDFAQIAHGSLAVVSAQLDAAMTDQVDEAALKRIKTSPHAAVWSDGQGFTGISLEHFVVAQRNLNNPDKDFYRQLIREGYTPQSVDRINTHYEDPRLKVTIIDQNGNPKGQAIREAVSNSHDALLGQLAGAHPLDSFDVWMIGQFGKGVKQIIDWLEPNGHDRVDVFTRQENSPAYQLTIKNAPNGQWYIQLKEIALSEFTAAAGQNVNHGTALSVHIEEPLASGEDTARPAGADNTLRGLERSVHERFAYVKNMKITTQLGAQERNVNGWETRRFIVPFDRPAPTESDKENRNVLVQLSAHRISIIDNGLGMNAMQLSRMFVPASGDKQPVGLKSQKDIQRELEEKLTLVHDTREEFTKVTPALVFARNEEVVFTAPLPGINPQAIVSGRLMLELGRLIQVQQARDKIIFAPQFDEQGISLIQRGILEIVDRIVRINSSSMNLGDKLKYINTIIAGLEQLIAGNPGNEVIVKKIVAAVKEKISPIVQNLEEQGVIILPQEVAFAQLEIPEGRGVVYLNAQLFDWKREKTLKVLGGKVVDKTVMKFVREEKGQRRYLTLIAVPFKEKYLKAFREFDANEYHFKTPLPLPLINADSFIAIPLQFSEKFIELADKRLKGQLTDVELAREFQILAQLIKSAVDDQTITSYEVGEVKGSVELPVIDRSKFKISEGQIDSQAVNRFLTGDPPTLTLQRPKAMSARELAIPSNARMRYMPDQEGNLIDIATGQVAVAGSQRTAVVDLQTLAKNIYLITRKNGQRELFKKVGGKLESQTQPKSTWTVSAKGNYVFDRDDAPSREGKPVSIFNVNKGDWQVFRSGNDGLNCRGIQISADERFAFYWRQDSGGHLKMWIQDLETMTEKWMTFMSIPKRPHFKLHPVAPFAIGDNGEAIDLNTGEVIEGKYFVHNSGVLAVMGNNQEIKIRHFGGNKPRLLDKDDFNGRVIETVSMDQKGKAVVQAGMDNFLVETDGRIIKLSAALAQEAFLGEKFLEEIVLYADGASYEVVPHDATDRRDYLVSQPLVFNVPIKIYKHPKFDIFIDERDGNHPVAIDIRTKQRIKYEGQIVGAIKNSDPFTLWVKRNNSPMIDQYANAGRMTGQEGAIDGVPAQFMLYKNEYSHKWFLMSDDLSKFGVTSLALQDYTQAFFDGKYFVLTNPQTRAVAYLDPNDHQHPIILPPIEQQFQATVPADANLKYMIDFQGTVVDTATGQAVIDQHGDVFKNVQSLRALGDDRYIVAWQGFNYLMLIKNGKIKVIFGVSNNILVSTHGRYIFEESKEGVLSTGVSIYDTSSGSMVEFQADGLYNNLQVSVDEKYLTYIRNDKGESFLCIYDPETRLTKEFDLVSKMPSYTLSAQTPMAIIKYAPDRWDYVDFKTGKLIKSSTTPAVTDPQGRFTVFSPSEIYLHDTRQWLALPSRLRSKVIIAVAFGKYHPGMPYSGDEFLFAAYDEDHRAYTVVRMRDGTVLFNFGVLSEEQQDNNFEYFEKIYSSGFIQFSKPSINFSFSVRDELHTIYLHPKFDGLAIDESDPAHPVAIDLTTGLRIPYEGEIFALSHKYGYFWLAAFKSGEIIIYDIDHTRPLAKNVVGAILDNEKKTGVLLNHEGIYGFFEDVFEHPADHLNIRKEDYPQVIFDGKYFVFMNPDTKQTLFLDPQHPEGFEKSIAALPFEPPAGPQVPFDAHARYMVNAAGQLIEIGTGLVFNMGGVSGKIKSIQSLDNNYFVIKTANERHLVEIKPEGYSYLFSFNEWGHHGDQYVFIDNNGPIHLMNKDLISLSEHDFKKEAGLSDIRSTHLTYHDRYFVFEGKKDGVWSVYSWDITKAKFVEAVTEKFKEIRGDSVSLYPHSPIVYVYNQTGMIAGSIDVTTGELMKGKVYSVPSEDFSIEVNGGVMRVHLHPNDKHAGKVISLDALGLDLKKRVYYGAFWNNIPGFYGLMLEDSHGDYYSVKDTGEVEFLNRMFTFDSYESVSVGDRGGKYRFRGNVPVDIPPDSNHVFKHPQFDLLIDETNAAHPIAIDIRSGGKTEFQGAIIAQEAGKLVTIHEGNIKFSYMSYGSGVDMAMQTQGAYDAIPANFYVFKNSLGKYVMSTVRTRRADPLDIDAQAYPKVSFDGKYFVFEDPQTENVIYLDPADPGHPVYVSKPKPQARIVNVDQQALFQKGIIEHWNSDVLTAREGQGRDHWMAQVSQGINAIQRFIERIPEDYQDELKGRLKEFVDAIYADQEKAVRDEFAKAFESPELPSDIKFSPGLPFNEIQQRLYQFQQALEPLTDHLMKMTGREQFGLQQDSWISLLETILSLSRDNALELNDVPALLQTALLGWHPVNSEQITNTPLISQLLHELETMNISMETQRKMVRFLSVASSESIKAPVVFAQLKKFLPGDSALKEEARLSYLDQLARSFDKPNENDILAALKSSQVLEGLGEARAFVVFLTTDLERTRVRERTDPPGEDVAADMQGPGLDQLTTAYRSGKFSTVEELIAHFAQVKQEPETGSFKAEIRQMIHSQKEAGGEKAEIAQNSKDAGAKNLRIEYFKDEKARESIEEATDDGPGPKQMLALFIYLMSTKSDKEAASQLTGRFGTGKFTYYAGVDRVEWIVNNGQEAYMFTIHVDSNDGEARMTRIRRIDPKAIARGVTVRRIKKLERSIPELDQMLGQHSWKIFTGMASGRDGFTISFLEEGKGKEEIVRPLEVKGKELLSEAVFMHGLPIRIWKTQDADMPNQFLDKNGLRVEDLKIKEKFLTLIPQFLRHYLDELGLEIELPLELIQNRSSYEREDEQPFFDEIRKYVAVEFYRALVYQTLTDESFVLDDFSRDWETSSDDSYWEVLDNARNRPLVDLVEHLNRYEYDQVTAGELENLRSWLDQSHSQEKMEAFMKFIVRLQAKGYSLLERRVAVQIKVNEEKTRRMASKLGVDLANARDFFDRHGIERVLKAENLSQSRDLKDLTLRGPQSAQEEILMSIFKKIGSSIGFENISIVERDYPARAAFYPNLGLMVINASLADEIDQTTLERGHLYRPVNSAVHESAHYFEKRFAMALTGQSLPEHEPLVPDDEPTFTHQSKGRFSTFYRMIAMIALAKLSQKDQAMASAKRSKQSQPKPTRGHVPEGAVSPHAGDYRWSSPSRLPSNVRLNVRALQGNPQNDYGGIDFNPKNINIETKGDGQVAIKFHLDGALLWKFQNARGFVPVIMNISSLKSLEDFLVKR